MIVRTQSATYVLDVEDGVLTRMPNEEASEVWPVAELRKDHQIIPYRLHPSFPLTVGEPAVFILDIRNDGVETIRRTTPIMEIEA